MIACDYVCILRGFRLLQTLAEFELCFVCSVRALATQQPMALARNRPRQPGQGRPRLSISKTQDMVSSRHTTLDTVTKQNG